MVNVGEYSINGSYGIDARNDGFSKCISSFKYGYFGSSMLNIVKYWGYTSTMPYLKKEIDFGSRLHFGVIYVEFQEVVWVYRGL